MTKSTHMWNPIRHDHRLMRTRPIGQNDMLSYADATARDAALPNPVNGMVAANDNIRAAELYLDSLGRWRGLRPAVITVAAADASLLAKAAADYVCTGTDDHVQIQAAIDSLPTTGNVTVKAMAETNKSNSGGEVRLTHGSFQIADHVDFTGLSNVMLTGEGAATVIYNGNTSGKDALFCDNSGAGDNEESDRLCIQNLMIHGNANSGCGINFTRCNYTHLHNVRPIFNGSHGIKWVSATGETYGGAENKTIIACFSQFNGGDGIHIDSLHDTQIAECWFEENDGRGLYIKDAVQMQLSNICAEDNYGTHDLLIEGSTSLTRITGSIFEGNVSITAINTTITGSELRGVFDVTDGTTIYSHLALSNTTIGTLASSRVTRLYMSNVEIQSINSPANVYVEALLKLASCRIRCDNQLGIYAVNAGTRLDFGDTTFDGASGDGTSVVINGNGQTNVSISFNGGTVHEKAMNIGEALTVAYHNNTLQGTNTDVRISHVPVNTTGTGTNSNGVVSITGNVGDGVTFDMDETIHSAGIVVGNAFVNSTVSKDSTALTYSAENIGV